MAGLVAGFLLLCPVTQHSTFDGEGKMARRVNRYLWAVETRLHTAGMRRLWAEVEQTGDGLPLAG